MKIIIPFITAFVSVILVVFLINKEISSLNSDFCIKELQNVSQNIEKRIADISHKMFLQNKGFCETVSDDRDFSMKLLVEKDFSASEVTDISINYMKAMNFSFLEICDENNIIISSGHFSANIGNKSQNCKNMDNKSVFVFDKIKGQDVISFQVKNVFFCADKKLQTVGGLLVDFNFISHLKPYDGIIVLFKLGQEIIGMDDIETMSDIKNNRIIINDKIWIATSLNLSSSEEGINPELIIIKEEPKKLSLIDLFM